MTDSSPPYAGSALARLTEALGADDKRKGPPPVERWNPPYCGEIDMRIAADGTWHYMGSPINRPALVRLFSTVLRKDPERYVLVTPVERVGIAVEDAPFLAVEMAVDGEGEAAGDACPKFPPDLHVGLHAPTLVLLEPQGMLRPDLDEVVHIGAERDPAALALSVHSHFDGQEGSIPCGSSRTSVGA